MIWQPYAPTSFVSDNLFITKAKGVYLYPKEGPPLIDAISSWWSVIHGYNHPKLNQAIQKQLKQFSHIMFGGLTHEPAETLAKKLVEITPQSLQHVFFSDSGSVGVEVALKMSIQYWQLKKKPQKTKFITFKNAYHGDTFGAMSVCDPIDSMHHLFTPFLFKSLLCESPAQLPLDQWTLKLKQLLETNQHECASLILEPLVQCAGGMKVYSAEYLKVARQLCTQFNVLLILDEIATGFGRTGTLFACEQAHISPDILVLGKGLTGGYLPLAATLTNSEIFNTFTNYPFMHGPTFMANALACSVALASINLFVQTNCLEKIKKIEFELKTEFGKINSEDIARIEVKGAIGIIEVKEEKFLQGIQKEAIKNGIWLRPFGKIVYTMPAYSIKEKEIKKITNFLTQWFK